MGAPLLSVRDLRTAFHTDEGSFLAVDRVSFELRAGATLGLVGESGCGKSVTSLSIMGLLPQPEGVVEGGQILVDGHDILSLPESRLRQLRGGTMSMIFQEPMTSLNPVLRVGDQIVEAVTAHRDVSRKEAQERAIDTLALVGIPSPKERALAYPHELSGGMRQRVMIAIALACEPKLLIADEPTTALDVTIQAQILELLRDLQEKMSMSILFITHDLGVVAELTDDVVVMYAGVVVERASTEELFAEPKHPYTRGLLASVPGYRGTSAATYREHGETPRRRLPTIPGLVPDPRKRPTGCRFRERCPSAMDVCATREPALRDLSGGRAAACFLLEPDQAVPSAAEESE
ncbi:MAG: ABC transporter ATP-binding protein [Sandaracinaceae bacterium]